MSIGTVTVERAQCDACGHNEYANEQTGRLERGFSISITEHYESGEMSEPMYAYACKAAHMGRAAKAVVDAATDRNGDDAPVYGNGSVLPGAAGAYSPTVVTPELTAEWANK